MLILFYFIYIIIFVVPLLFTFFFFFPFQLFSTQRFAVGTLSHILDQTAAGYEPLPNFPGNLFIILYYYDYLTHFLFNFQKNFLDVVPPKEVRDEVIEEPPKISPSKSDSSLFFDKSSNSNSKKDDKDDFWGDSDKEGSGSDKSSRSGSSSGSRSRSGSFSGSESNSYTTDEDEPEETPKKQASSSNNNNSKPQKSAPKSVPEKKEESMDDLWGSPSPGNTKILISKPNCFSTFFFLFSTNQITNIQEFIGRFIGRRFHSDRFSYSWFFWWKHYVWSKCIACRPSKIYFVETTYGRWIVN